MVYEYRNNVLNSYIFIFLLITIDFLSIFVQCYNRSIFDIPDRFHHKLATEELSSHIRIYKPAEFRLGTPNILPPSFLRDALSNVLMSLDTSVHQYSNPQGCIELRTEIAALYSILNNRTLDPNKNVLVTLGATEALYLTFLVHTLPDDEWIVIEPANANYFAQIKMAGGIVRPVRLRKRETQGKFDSGDLVFDEDELSKAFNARTKGIVINNPHNPTGKIFTEEELLTIARLAIKWNTLIISDEVYEWTIFDSNKYIRMASLGDEIFNRTITVSSISKTYFATGWRVGWALGPQNLIRNLIGQQPYVGMSLTPYSQLAAAKGLRQMRNELGYPHSYFIQLAKSLEDKRNIMLKVLNRIGMETIVPQAGYYIFANWTSLESSVSVHEQEGSSRDIKFIKWLIENLKIVVAPGSGFYQPADKHIGENFVRIAFVKNRETLKRLASSVGILLE